MTVEEAVEVILRGGAWTECTLCDGTGNVRIEGGRGWDMCIPCEGYGRLIALDYYEACRVLGRELPEREHPSSFSSDLRPHRVSFPTFEIDPTMTEAQLTRYSVPISKLLDDAKEKP